MAKTQIMQNQSMCFAANKLAVVASNPLLQIYNTDPFRADTVV